MAENQRKWSKRSGSEMKANGIAWHGEGGNDGAAAS